MKNRTQEVLRTIIISESCSKFPFKVIALFFFLTSSRHQNEYLQKGFFLAKVEFMLQKNVLKNKQNT